MKRKIFVLFLTCVFALSLFACAEAKVTEESAREETSAAEIVEMTDGSSAEIQEENNPDEWQTEYPLVFSDSYGNVTEIDSEPTRIISCAPNVTELIFALDRGDRLVGRTDFCDYPEAVFDIESVGMIDSPDIETIIALEPDIVLASSIFTEEAFNRLTELGILVIVLHQEYDLNGVQDMIRSVGLILNQNEIAAQHIHDMQMSIADTQSQIEGMDRPSVYYVVSFGEYGDYTAGGDTFVHQLIEAAGGRNIAESISGWSFSLEKLIEDDPDIILISSFMYEYFVEAEPYNQLSAVQNGNVFGIDANLIERQGVRNAQAVEMMARLFYPEACNS